MGRISIAIGGALAALALGVIAQTAPERIYGIADGSVELFTPTQVVAAGGGAGSTLPHASSVGQHLSSTNTIGGVTWVNPPAGPRAFGSAAPVVPVANGNAGTATTVSRSDHAHPPSPQIASTLMSLAGLTDEVEAVTGPANMTADVGMVYTVTQCPEGTTGNCETAFRAGGGGGGTTLPDASSVGQHLSSTNTSGGITWVNPPVGLPSGAAADQILSQNADNTGAEWISSTTVVLEGSGVTGTAQGNRLIGSNSAGNGIALSTPSAAVLAGLPALTGHGGQCLKATTAATGLEFANCGGASGGALSMTRLTQTASITPTSSRSNATYTYTWPNANCTAVQGAAGRLLYLRGIFSTTTIPAFVFGWHLTRFDTTVNTDRTDSAQFAMPVALEVGGEVDFELPSAGGMANSARRCAVVFESAETAFAHAPQALQFEIYELTGGGGGGGSNPTIPSPTAAGALQHLRVNAGGSAYELAAPPIGVPPFSGSNSLWQLQVNSAGDGLEWSNIADREITALDTRLTAIDNPRGASAPGVGMVYTVASCAGSGASTVCQGGYRDPPSSFPYGSDWVDLGGATINNHNSGAGLSLTISGTAIHEGLRATNPYRRFVFQAAYTTQGLYATAEGVFSGIPLGQSGPQANQTADMFGTVTGFQRTCNARMIVGTASTTLSTHSGCVPGFGLSGNVNLFWKLWGVR